MWTIGDDAEATNPTRLAALPAFLIGRTEVTLHVLVVPARALASPVPPVEDGTTGASVRHGVDRPQSSETIRA